MRHLKINNYLLHLNRDKHLMQHLTHDVMVSIL